MISKVNVPLLDAATIELIRAIQAGDREAREILFERYLPRAREIARLRVPREVTRMAAREDIVQDALIRALRNLEHFEESSEGTFRNYLARCVQTAMIDAWRKGHREKNDEDRTVYPGFDLGAIIITPETPSQVASARELHDRIVKALGDMDEPKREVIILGRLCRMSSSELARELGLRRTGTARVLLSRALKELEQRIRERD